MTQKLQVHVATFFMYQMVAGKSQGLFQTLNRF